MNYIRNKRELTLIFPSNSAVKKRVLARFMMLDRQADDKGWKGVGDTPVDEVIFSRNRQMRLVGNSKTGTPPMRLVTSREGFLHIKGVSPNPDNPYAKWDNHRRYLVKLGYSRFSKLLVAAPGYQHSVTSLRVPMAFPYDIQVSRHYRELLPDDGSHPHLVALLEPHAEEREGLRFYRRPTDSDSNARASRYVGAVRPKAEARDSSVIDADERLVGPDHVVREVAEYGDGDNVYHMCIEEGGTAGVPSGFFFTDDREGTAVMHCFACGVSFFVLPVSKPEPFPCRTNLYGAGKMKITDVPDTKAAAYSEASDDDDDDDDDDGGSIAPTRKRPATFPSRREHEKPRHRHRSRSPPPTVDGLREVFRMIEPEPIPAPLTYHVSSGSMNS
jgi:hypothetical protein